jgi:hypothetical protein
MGITALISLISGLVSGSLPKLLDFWGKSIDFKQELKVRELEFKFRDQDHKWAMERAAAEAELKLNESYYDALTEEGKATREQMAEMIRQQFEPTGVLWIDCFNSLIRPVTALFVIVLFFMAVTSYIFGNTTMNPDFGKEMATLFSFMVEGMVSFIFGYRAVPKPVALR